MPSSMVPAVLDGLVQVMHAIFDPLDILVLDGPEPIAGQPDRFVGVGYDGDPSAADDEAVTFTQEWAALGAMHKTELITVVCSIGIVSAETVKAARTEAFALFALVEVPLRNASVWPAGTSELAITGGSFHPVVTDEAGVGGRLPFTVFFRCRI
jgi:hypothetical protein